jgi:hypothetical protein
VSKKAWMYILRYLLAIGLFVVYSEIFDKHDINWIVIAGTIGFGLGAFPDKHEDKK